NILLLEYAADGKAVDHVPSLAHSAAGLYGVALGVGVEVTFLVVPVGLLPGGKIAAHLQVECDGHEGLAGQIVALGLISGCSLRYDSSKRERQRAPQCDRRGGRKDPPRKGARKSHGDKARDRAVDQCLAET